MFFCLPLFGLFSLTLMAGISPHDKIHMPMTIEMEVPYSEYFEEKLNCQILREESDLPRSELFPYNCELDVNDRDNDENYLPIWTEASTI